METTTLSLINYLKNEGKFIAIVTQNDIIFKDFISMNPNLKNICIQISKMDDLRGKDFFMQVNLPGASSVSEEVKNSLLIRIK